MVDLRNFLLNTDAPIDKIIGSSTGSVTVPSNDFADVIINHGFSFTPLFYVKWSTSPTFSPSYESQWFQPSSVPYSIYGNSSSSDMRLSASNLSGSSVTLYYQIIYFMPSDVSTDVPSVSLDDFQLNTDYNYTKIVLEGVLNSGSGTIDHNLGYIPQVEAWYVRSSDGRCLRLDYSYPEDPGLFSSPEVEVTSTQIIFRQSQDTFNNATKYYYKIYAEGA